MAKRPPNYRQVKTAATRWTSSPACSVSTKITVRSRVKAGLPTSDEKRPVLILVNDLAAFLEARRAGHKRPRKAGEF
jgi:hypothetical protein